MRVSKINISVNPKSPSLRLFRPILEREYRKLWRQAYTALLDAGLNVERAKYGADLISRGILH
jgi:hypothetical protein